MLARCSLLNTSRTDSISKSAPLTSVGRSRMWRILEEGKDARARGSGADRVRLYGVTGNDGRCERPRKIIGRVDGALDPRILAAARRSPIRLVPSEMRARMTTSCSTSGSSRPCVLSTWMTGTPVLERPVRRPSRERQSGDPGASGEAMLLVRVEAPLRRLDRRGHLHHSSDRGGWKLVNEPDDDVLFRAATREKGQPLGINATICAWVGSPVARDRGRNGCRRARPLVAESETNDVW